MPWSKGGGPQSGGSPQHNDLEALLKRSQDKLKQVMPGGTGLPGSFIFLISVAIVAIISFYAFTFSVDPDELGVVMLFGKPVRTELPGLHFRLPYLIEEVRLPKVTRQNIIEIGMRSSEAVRGVRSVPEESLMLTGDENIVDINFVVFWRIKDAQKYLFNIQKPDITVKEVAESAMRDIVGQSNIQPLLTGARQKTEQAVQKLMQEVLDSYGAGVSIDQVQLQKVDPPTQVIDAFRDVQAARADKERLQNEAGSYAQQGCSGGTRRSRAYPASRAGLQGANRGRGYRPDRPVPQSLRGIQEGARGNPQAHVSGDHGACPGRHRQDHPRQQGWAARRAVPVS